MKTVGNWGFPSSTPKLIPPIGIKMANEAKSVNITIKDIAKQAGVSVSTVSRVMSGKDTAVPISEKTRKKVMEVCDELKFLPDVNYTKLQERRSYIIGLMIPRSRPNSPLPLFSDENIGLFLSALEPGLSERSYSILIQGVDPDYEDSKTYLKILRNNSVDGLIIWDAFLNLDSVKILNKEDRPSICAAFPYEGAKNFIVPDNFRGSYDMTKHLISLGHRHIVYLNGGMNEPVDQLREQGYRKAMEEKELPTLILNGDYTFKGGYACGEKVIRDHKTATAIFAANDLMAIGAMEYAKLAGKSIPEDIAVAGFDGSSHSSIATPHLTTGRLPMLEMGKLAASSLIDLIEGEIKAPVQLTLPIEIIKRESTVGTKKK